MASSTKKPISSNPTRESIPPKLQPSNGVITDNPTAPGGPAVNKKKQKRRQKEKARQAVSQEQQTLHDYSHSNGHLSSDIHPNPDLHYDVPEYASDAVEPDDFTYSDEDEPYPYDINSVEHDGTGAGMMPSAKKGKYSTDPYGGGYSRASSYAHTYGQHPPPLPPLPSGDTLRTVQGQLDKGSIWDSSGPEERQRIKEFWMNLGEKERRALVNVEKKDVLKKMKEQQKHSCSCTVCGRKRTAIEEELENLYNAYYTELENYAKKTGNALPSSGRSSRQLSRTTSNQPKLPQKLNRGREHNLSASNQKPADPESYSEDDFDEEYSGDDADDMQHRHANDFFTFGNSLTVKGNILTVADDLLRNDGQKFIDMMEQLAERRMQREEETREAAYPSSYGSHAGHAHPPPLDDEDEGDEDYDEEEEYESQEDDYEDEEEMDALTDEQRMEEGKRMFQIFAARLFEQRVLNAYRVKVSDERARLLIEEEEADKNTDPQQKNTRDAEKKKQKRLKQKQKAAEQKAAKEEAEAAVRAKKEAEEQEKKEKERLKREENRKKQEAERQRKAQKEAEERDRKAETARKKAAEVDRKKNEEKQRRDEAQKKVKEEQDAKDKEGREKRRQEEQNRLESEGKAKQQADWQEHRQRKDQLDDFTRSAQQHDIVKKLPTKVALPPNLVPRTSYNLLDSPVTKIATPALPKAPTPSRPRESSRAVSQTSRTPEQTSHSKQSTPPRSTPSQASTPMTSLPQMRSPIQPLLNTQPPQASPMRSQPYQPTAFHAHQPPVGATQAFNGSNMGGLQTTMFSSNPNRMQFNPQMQSFQSHTLPAPGFPRPFGASPLAPPPGMQPFIGAQHPQPMYPRPFQPDTRQMTSPVQNITPQQSLPSAPAQHLRQGSLSQENSILDTIQPPSIAPPISRPAPPAPIKRPASTKPMEYGSDMERGSQEVDELSKHLGSSALLGDTEEMPGDNAPRASAVGSSFESMHSHFGPGLRGQQGDVWAPTPAVWKKPSNPGWGSSTIPQSFPRTTTPRQAGLRSLMCQACRSLTTQSPVNSGYVDFSEIVKIAAETTRSNHMEPNVTLNELRSLLETEGDASNGGGFFNVQSHMGGARLFVKWQPDSHDPSPVGLSSRGLGLGDIGSNFHSMGLPTLGGLGGPRGF